MQGGAPPRIDRRVKQLLRHHFTDARAISRHFPTAWPPHSPDITPCDFWLWGFLKDNIHHKRPASLPHLRDSILRHVLDIPADSFHSAVENMVLRYMYYIRGVPKTLSIKRKSKTLLNQREPLTLLQPMLGPTQQHFQPSRRQDKFLQLNPAPPVL
ncbi:hypothetical protein AVEN_221251-1 [Araneus ventricosus]|uniref:Tc1-like transposase DDE domain-containing protein n=1 Tax=Araneus ventricosus TaxID=182803 RepID=A0A4Y2LT99_ARAVE|nr:hypothetical protein AVEN_221251-1 [Araneus ventricosus]